MASSGFYPFHGEITTLRWGYAGKGERNALHYFISIEYTNAFYSIKRVARRLLKGVAGKPR
jgi:hypothetical protein